MAKFEHVLRNFRNMAPGPFHAFNQRVKRNLTDNKKIPDWVWAANPALMSSYLLASEKHDSAFHEAAFGSKLAIAEREVLQQQIVLYLDEIAALLEAAAVRTPEVLLSSGFDLAKERRGRPRPKAVPEDLVVSNAEPPPSATS